MSAKPRLAAFVATAALLAAGVAFAAPAGAAPAEIDYWNSSCPTSLTYGEDDGCVVYLQDMLNTFGFSLSLDGQFGAHTLAAVKWVQTKAHLQNSSVGVDGQVGPVTKSWIDKFYSNDTYTSIGAGGACAITLHTYPDDSAYNGGASATVGDWNNSSTCTGWLERSDNGGASWYSVSGRHTPGVGLTQTTDVYSDDPSQLSRACVAFSGSGDSGTICTIGM